MADLKAAQARLNRAKDKARRTAMGPPLKLSDVNLDTLATVSDADMPSAEALWRDANPGPLADLLSARPAEEA